MKFIEEYRLSKHFMTDYLCMALTMMETILPKCHHTGETPSYRCIKPQVKPQFC